MSMATFAVNSVQVLLAVVVAQICPEIDSWKVAAAPLVEYESVEEKHLDPREIADVVCSDPVAQGTDWLYE